MNKSNYIISEFEIRSFTSSEITMKFNTFRSTYLQRPIYRYNISSVLLVLLTRRALITEMSRSIFIIVEFSTIERYFNR